ncbi:MAG: integrase [Rhodobiaceae bacterium]|nr:integrase [Rhodobiaceae bacterium]OUT91009.1 MAG: hypothetical protein CBB89_06545 [Rhizobiales bacterium TMED29]
MGYDMLSKTKIQKLRIGSKVCEGDGLYFKKTKADGGQWSYRYTSSGKSREIGLGVYPIIDLLEARRLRDDNRRLRARGKDPIIEKRKAEQAKRLKDGVKFSDIAEKYIQSHEPQWRNKKSAQAWRNTLATYVYPELDKWPLEDITSKQIADLLLPIWHSKSETARRVQQRIVRIFDAACANGIMEGDNPADWQRRLQHLLSSHTNKPIKHHRALDFRDIPELFKQLAAHDCVSARALEFNILTAARTSEVTMAVRKEIDTAKALWSIPGHRMKMNQPHQVPLSRQASALADAVMRQHNQSFIFRGIGRSGRLSNNSMRKFLQVTMKRHPLTVHGFRSTFREWAAWQRKYDRLAIEFSLAHKLKNRTESAYMRSNLIEERRDLMQDWADYCFSGQNT